MAEQHPAVCWFIQLVDGWNAPVWGELLLWETLEGKRAKPFWFFHPLSEDELGQLKTLRDELRIWPTRVSGSWELLDVMVWKHYAKTHTADGVRDRLAEEVRLARQRRTPS